MTRSVSRECPVRVAILHDHRRPHPKRLVEAFGQATVLTDTRGEGVKRMHERALELTVRHWERNQGVTLILEDDAIPGMQARLHAFTWMKRVMFDGEFPACAGVSFFLANGVKTCYQSIVDSRFSDALLRGDSYVRFPFLLHGVAYFLHPLFAGRALEAFRDTPDSATDIEGIVDSVLQPGEDILYTLPSLFNHPPHGGLVEHRGARPSRPRDARVFMPADTEKEKKWRSRHSR